MSIVADVAGALAREAGKPDQLTLAVDGARYGGWLTIEVTRSLDQFSHAFSLTYTDRWVSGSKPWPIREGARCEVFFGKHLLVTGYVNVAQWKVDGDSWELDASGRSLSGDLEDCSAIHETGFWQMTPPVTIINQLIAPYGLKAISTVSQALQPIERFALNEGETVHDAIERLCKALALLPVTRPEGDLELMRGAGAWQKARSRQDILGSAKPASKAVKKKNSLAPYSANTGISVGGGATIVVPVGQAIERRLHTDDQNRYSDYASIGQSRGSRFRAGKIVAHMAEAVTDPAISRHRPVILVANHSVASSDDLKARATWERNVRAGKSLRYSLLLPGVYAPNKKPWLPGAYCSATDPAFGLDTTLILVSAKIRGNDKSLVTELEFTLPEAYSTLEYPQRPPNKKGSVPDPPAPECVDLSEQELALVNQFRSGG
jgi:prophage tail gpP-like protein